LQNVLPEKASRRYVLFLGRIAYMKGVDILCDAFAVVAGSARGFDGVGKGQDGGEVLPELVMQLAGERAPFVVADFDQTLGQCGALLGGLCQPLAEIADGAADHRKLDGIEFWQLRPVLAVGHPLQCPDDRPRRLSIDHR